MNHRRVACLLFFSGASALIYQTVWMRDLRLIFGASTLATGAVLAIFMGGLGLGSAVLGRRADRHPTPLAFYGQLEMLIALTAAITPLLLMGVRWAYIAVGGSASLGSVTATLVRLALTALVLFIPTALMGGTLPAAARAVESADDAGRRRLALLYGVNTTGAVAGTLVSTFYLLEHFGNRGTLLLAAAVNLAIGVLAWHLGGGVKKEEAAPPEVAFTESRMPPRLVLVAAALVGFAFLLMELVWYRMLSPLLGGTTFMFGLVLAVALAGIGAGGALYSMGGGQRTASASAFTLTCTFEALAMAFPLALGDRLAVVANSLRALSVFGFAGYVISWVLLTVLVVFPAALIAGYQFPLLISLLGRGRESVGHEVGLTYAWNTGGAIVASLLGSFVLIPSLGAVGSWKVASAVLIGLGAVTFLVSLREKRHLQNAFAIAAAAGGIACMMALGPTAVWRHSGIGAGRTRQPVGENALREWLATNRRTLLVEADGSESSIALDATEDLALIVNGKSDGSARSDAGTQVMSGLIGALIHPGVRNAMIVGLGTGSTAGWLGAVPGIQSVDVVELEPVVVRLAEYFAPVNRRVTENPKVHITVGDAREVLLTSRRKYDLIFSEPSNPYRAGIASLYTREFYAAAAERLEQGGLFLQWVQTYAADAETLRTIYATIRTSFPSVQTWTTGPGDLVLVASKEPIVIDVDTLRKRLAQEPFREAAHVAWRAESVEGFLAHFVASEILAERASAAPIDLNTDDRQVIEFSFARALNFDRFNMQVIADTAARIDASRPRLKGTADWSLVESNRASLFWLTMPNPRNEFSRQYRDQELQGALAVWRASPFEPVNSAETMKLAHVLANAGDETALRYANDLRLLRPAEADAIVAILREKQGQSVDAVPVFRAAFERYRDDPWADGLVMMAATNSAIAISTRDPQFANAVLDVFSREFSTYLLNDTRRLAYLAISWSAGKCSAATLTSLQELEPNVPWLGSTLQIRDVCYGAAKMEALAKRARRDRLAFANNQPGGLLK